MILEILGIELEADFADADFCESLESAMTAMQNKVAAIDLNKMPASTALRIQCDAVYECFDSLFGDGTAQELFSGKKNVRICLSALNQLQEAQKAGDPEMIELANVFKDRADQVRTNGMNRAQRRTAMKKDKQGSVNIIPAQVSNTSDIKADREEILKIVNEAAMQALYGKKE